jgi:surface polysaccharide O-acyltransferase-like enzyme
MAELGGPTRQERQQSHLYELDMVRAVTALAVVGVHVTAFTIILADTPTGKVLQDAAVSALHFTREIFIAITAFVMVYVYAGRPFSAKTFWRKRGIGVLIPYVIWSVFYDVVTKPALPPLQWLLRIVGEILVGGASFQLYYILLTLEFYLVLPWFLSFMSRAGKRPWRLLGISFAVQVIVLALDYHFVQSGPLSTSGLSQILLPAQDRFLPLYQLYMVAGGLAAMYRTQVQAFLRRHSAWAIGALALGLVLLWGNLVYQTDITHAGMTYGIAVFQPAMAVYGLAVTAFFYWVTSRWAARRAPGPPRGHRFWLVLSNASFGIYLMHAYLLDLALTYLVPHLPGHGPEALQVTRVWALVAGGTVALCSLWLYVPGLSRLIGRPCALRPDSAIAQRLNTAGASARLWLGKLPRALRPPRRVVAAGPGATGAPSMPSMPSMPSETPAAARLR